MTGKYWWEEPLARMGNIVCRAHGGTVLITHISMNEVHRKAEEPGISFTTHIEVTFAPATLELHPDNESPMEIKA